jgi:sugar phosphate permease
MSRVVQIISSRLYYGWVIVALGFLAQGMTSFSIQGLSTYITPLQREFGWSVGETAAGRSFQQVDAILGPLTGYLVDRWGPRRLMTVGVILFAVAFAYFSQISSLWGYYVACTLMALANSLIGLLVVSISLNNWFRRKLATAMGFAVTGYAVGGMFFLPLVVAAQVSFGWRMAALGTAIALLVVGLPVILFMRDRPEAYGLPLDESGPHRTPSAQSAKGPEERPVDHSLRQAIRTRAFWLIATGTVLAYALQSALIVHQFPFFEHLLNRETAALLFTEINFFNLIGRVAGGVMGDRFQKNMLMGITMGLTAFSLLILFISPNVAFLLVYGAIFGFSWGCRTVLVNALQGDYFGRSSFGKIAGLVQTMAAPLAIISPIVVGLWVDRVGDYNSSFLILAFVAALSSATFFAAKRPHVRYE